MYLDFYHLKREPFRITPDPEFLYLSPSHKEALAAIAYGVEQRKGIIAVTGEVGTGKTTILRYYLGKADPERLKAAHVFNPAVSFPVLLQTIFRELGIPFESGEAGGMVDRFHGYLIEEYKKDHTVVLFIDEAQNVPVETLENLRMLSNLESSEDKLLQIVLCGQTELESLLDRNELRQLKSRIAVRATISPLSRKESLAYIRHRLSMSSRKESDIFTKAALERIVRKAKGQPEVDQHPVRQRADHRVRIRREKRRVSGPPGRSSRTWRGGPPRESGCGPSLRSAFSCSLPPDSGSMRGTPPPLRNPHATPSSSSSNPEDERIGFSRGSPGDPWEKSTKPWKRPNGRGGGRKSPPCSSSLPPGNGLRPVSRLSRNRRWSPFRGTSTPSCRTTPRKVDPVHRIPGRGRHLHRRPGLRHGLRGPAREIGPSPGRRFPEPQPA